MFHSPRFLHADYSTFTIKGGVHGFMSAKLNDCRVRLFDQKMATYMPIAGGDRAVAQTIFSVWNLYDQVK